MSGLSVSLDARGVKVYSLSSFQALPSWLSETQKRKLRKDDDYRRRVELLQGFDFPTASQRVKMTRDGLHVIATGTYPPGVKIFELEELGLKVERRLDCEVVDFEILSEDFSKPVFLLANRTVAFHAAYGKHYELRIPKFGRCLAYHPASCDLLLGGAGREVYRLNLDEGRFQEPLAMPFEGVNALSLSPVHHLIAAGGEARVHFVDPRSRQSLTTLALPRAHQEDPEAAEPEVTCLRQERDGLTLAVGSSDGSVFIYDIRSPRPLRQKQHVNELPIVALDFYSEQKLVVSADAKSLKVWPYGTAATEELHSSSAGHDAGDRTCNIEAVADVADICIVRDRARDTGLIFAAGEQPRIQSYFVPSLGPAPKWCSFLEGLTEELEENGLDESTGEKALTVYEDYKFVTEAELKELNVESLKGTPLLRGYMHGYFMDAKLYQKLRQVSDPFAYERYRKKKLQEKIEAKRGSRIAVKKRLPRVNAALAQRMVQKRQEAEAKARAKKESRAPAVADAKDAEKTAAGAPPSGHAAKIQNPTGDTRFASLFTDAAFQVDEESEEFRLRNPSGTARRRGRREMEDEGSEDEMV